MVKTVASRLAQSTGQAGEGFQWEVSLIQDGKVNAFCLPAGKIVVYTGILRVARNDAALATVLGHEMAHATSRHGAQRVFQQNLTQTAHTGVAVSLSDMDYNEQRAVMGPLGPRAQFGVLMPFSRKHESEADEIGLTYMARAGFDREESLRFWQNGRGKRTRRRTAGVSFHASSHQTCIQQLQAWMPKALEEYHRAIGR
ncbi:MAG: M48 family metallopeptidase [Verrucomicrobiota bacterium]|nr:M48 family metallopeptidase [Verrucomicrobiota bacterium]